jgi:hypothetical protein
MKFLTNGINVPNKKCGFCLRRPSKLPSAIWEIKKEFYNKDREKNFFQTTERWRNEYNQPRFKKKKTKYFSIYHSVRGWTVYLNKNPSQKSKKMWKYQV